MLSEINAFPLFAGAVPSMLHLVFLMLDIRTSATRAIVHRYHNEQRGGGLSLDYILLLGESRFRQAWGMHRKKR
jgi:hypothetical protein